MGTINRMPAPYTTGALAGAANSPIVTGVGTQWVLNGVAQVFPGDILIAPRAFYPILSVDSATQITLEIPLSAAIPLNTACRIIRYQPAPNASLLGTAQALLAQGSDSAPDVSRTIDSGATRFKLRINASGHVELAVGPSAAPDAALVPAITLSQTGQVLYSQGPPTGYVTRAALAAFAGISGASVSAFMASEIGDPDSADGSWHAYYVQAFAPVSGTLWGLILAYLQTPSPGPALTASAALTEVQAIWAAAQNFTS